VTEEVKNMAKTQELLYAVVGVGDYALEKAKGVTKVTDLQATSKLYKDFVKRGRGLSTRVKNSAPTKQAIAQTKTARTQIKAASTSLTKAVRANASGSTRKASAQTKVARSQVKAAATSVGKAAKANAKATRSAASKVVKAS
jgi:hypothetical protein